MNHPRTPGAALPGSVLHCRVTRADIDAMLDAYDSGMSDASTANCLSRAVARALHSSAPVPLVRHAQDQAELDLGDDCRVPVPPDLLAWLGAAETGAAAGPVEFFLSLPGEPAGQPPARGLSRPQRRLPEQHAADEETRMLAG